MLDFFWHGKKEVVEIVCPVIFTLMSFKKDQVSSLNEKGVKAVVLGQNVLTGKLRMHDFEGKYKVSVFFQSSRYTVYREITKPRNSETKYGNSETPKRNTETSLFLHFFLLINETRKNDSFQYCRT